jgi:hypothetical protein
MSSSIFGHTALNCSWQDGRSLNPSACDGAFGDLRHRIVGRAETKQLMPTFWTEADVVGVDERGHGQPRTVALRSGQFGKQLHDLFSENPVADRATVRLGGTVGLATDPPREPERVQPIGLAVRLDGIGDHPAVIVRSHQTLVGTGDEQVSVRDVPLAPVMGVIPAGPEPIPKRRHRVRVKKQHRRVRVLLGHPVGLRNAVQRRVLASEQRRPARHTSRRPGVMAMELDADSTQRVPGRQMIPPERPHRIGLVRRRVPLLVGHHDQDVRRRHARNVRLLPHTPNPPMWTIVTAAPPAHGPTQVFGNSATRGRRMP